MGCTESKVSKPSIPHNVHIMSFLLKKLRCNFQSMACLSTILFSNRLHQQKKRQLYMYSIMLSGDSYVDIIFGSLQSDDWKKWLPGLICEYIMQHTWYKSQHLKTESDLNRISVWILQILPDNFYRIGMKRGLWYRIFLSRALVVANYCKTSTFRRVQFFLWIWCGEFWL